MDSLIFYQYSSSNECLSSNNVIKILNSAPRKKMAVLQGACEFF